MASMTWSCMSVSLSRGGRTAQGIRARGRVHGKRDARALSNPGHPSRVVRRPERVRRVFPRVPAVTCETVGESGSGRPPDGVRLSGPRHPGDPAGTAFFPRDP
ncbi:hypothetical protein GCM10009727_80170 [Actinomadura napierensis]|uniref:Uncharacterized protein n=1 Tax=Actinomadura napierensis TaxID=267854 RepID=A0ABN3AES8_9ACTN